jgi:hypothetical protein
MIFRRSKQDPSPKIIGSEIVYKLVREWADEPGRYIYVLKSGEHYDWSDGIDRGLSRFYYQVYGKSPDAEGWIKKASGDLAWAQRIAEHYKINLPEESDAK